jgi:hypothetical protein
VVPPPWRTPDPPEAPAAARALLATLGGALQGGRGALDLLTLMVSSHEHLFAWEDLQGF